MRNEDMQKPPYTEPPMISTGEVVVTVSGHITTPAPRIDTTTPGKTINSMKRMRKWLYENAREEARHRGLMFYMQPPPKSATSSWPDGDDCSLILFDAF